MKLSVLLLKLCRMKPRKIIKFGLIKKNVSKIFEQNVRSMLFLCSTVNELGFDNRFCSLFRSFAGST